jgi:hypothetical protein
MWLNVGMMVQGKIVLESENGRKQEVGNHPYQMG